MKPAIMLLLLVFSVSAISGCTKEQTPHTVVEGYVLELDTKIPLDSIPVKLISFSGGVNFFGGSGSTGGVDYTDENGFYRFEFEGDGSYGIDTDGDWPEYYHLASHESVNKGEYNRIDIELSPQGWIRLHVKNVSPVDYLDRIGYTVGSNNSSQGWGTDVDKTEVYRVAANGMVWIAWNVAKNDTTTLYSDQVYAIGHDTVDYEILY